MSRSSRRRPAPPVVLAASMFAALLAAATCLAAQPVKLRAVRGSLTQSSTTCVPVVNASIRVILIGDGFKRVVGHTVTDSEGHFLVPHVPAENYFLEVVPPDQPVRTIEVRVGRGVHFSTKDLCLSLSSEPPRLEAALLTPAESKARCNK